MVSIFWFHIHKIAKKGFYLPFFVGLYLNIIKKTLKTQF